MPDGVMLFRIQYFLLIYGEVGRQMYVIRVRPQCGPVERCDNNIAILNGLQNLGIGQNH